MSGEAFKRTATFVGGAVLVGCAVADAAVNPFAFATAPQLFTAGTGLIALSLGMNPPKPRPES